MKKTSNTNILILYLERKKQWRYTILHLHRFFKFYYTILYHLMVQSHFRFFVIGTLRLAFPTLCYSEYMAILENLSQRIQFIHLAKKLLMPLDPVFNMFIYNATKFLKFYFIIDIKAETGGWFCIRTTILHLEKRQIIYMSSVALELSNKKVWVCLNYLIMLGF